jgi:predicted metalloprotease
LDETIYIDETFFDELVTRFGAEGGDVAEAYVIAHEVGHHVQKRLGVMDQVQTAQQQAGSQEEANDLSVRLELQADCLAGVWANSLRDIGVFLPGEIQEAIDAAAAVGDDRIQERVQGQVSPERWTHGSSAQRVEWFTRGFDTGDPSTCDTFG